jgi:hypothetical protein
MPDDNTPDESSRANTLTTVKNQILVEGFKGLALINGGAATALGAFLQAIWDTPSASPLRLWLLLGISFLVAGTAFAATTYLLRYQAFFDKHTTEPPRNKWWWLNWLAMGLSLLFFVVGMGLAVLGGFLALRCT